MNLTPIEQRMFNILSDGNDHTREELYACLSDDMALLAAIRPHLSNLRKKLPSSFDIVCLASSHSGPARYRLVRNARSKDVDADLPW